MSGAPDPIYVLARRVLLDALETLGDQRPAVILVGAWRTARRRRATAARRPKTSLKNRSNRIGAANHESNA